MTGAFIIGVAVGMFAAALIVAFAPDVDWEPQGMKIKLTCTDPVLANAPLVRHWLAMAEVQINEEFARREAEAVARLQRLVDRLGAAPHNSRP